MKRALWKSRIGFIWAAVGSAVGLGTIWRFPYVVGENGGAAFVILYLVCLVLVGFPVLLSEIAIGRKTQTSPSGAFLALGKSKKWSSVGKITIVTGFIISSFYSVIVGFTLGYLVEAILGHVTHFTTSDQALSYYAGLSSSSMWTVSYHFLFLVISSLLLYVGVNKGIEMGNKIMMPLLFVVLVVLALKGIFMTGAENGLKFLFYPNFSLITPTAIAVALGQAFFSLSLGQGTMVTYGSYLSQKENIPTTAATIPIFTTLISILAGMAIFTIVFSLGMPAASGPSLMFQTLPVIFSQIPAGYLFAILFFLLIFLAGLTSQISAMEPMISYLIDEKKWTRRKAVILTGAGVFLLGIPSALSFNLLSNMTLFGKGFFDLISFVSINILVPLGGLAAVIMAGWKWKVKNILETLKQGSEGVFQRFPIIGTYIHVSIKYIAPLIIVFILFDLLIR